MLLQHWNQSLPVPVQTLVRGGYLAVQTFFILSGFVLAQSYANARWNRETLKRFVVARFARIYPAYFVSLLLISWFALEFVLKAGHTAGEKARVLGDYAFVLQGWNAPTVGWNTPAWSLSCEFFFYACFPLLLLCPGRSRMRYVWLAFAAAMIAPVALSHAGIPSFWKPIYHLADFVAGIACARFYRALAESSLPLRRVGLWLASAALVVGAGFIIDPHLFDGTLVNLNTALRPTNMALLIGLAIGGGWLIEVLSHATAEYLGKVSYSMYILHIPLLWWYSSYTSFRWGSAPPAWVGFLFIALVIGASIAAYEFVEVPANRWIRDWSMARRQQAPERELKAAA